MYPVLLRCDVTTGPEAHSTSCTMATGPFPGVKRPERGVDHLVPSWSLPLSLLRLWRIAVRKPFDPEDGGTTTLRNIAINTQWHAAKTHTHQHTGCILTVSMFVIKWDQSNSITNIWIHFQRKPPIRFPRTTVMPVIKNKSETHKTF
jgi:hypothetical protein